MALLSKGFSQPFNRLSIILHFLPVRCEMRKCVNVHKFGRCDEVWSYHNRWPSQLHLYPDPECSNLSLKVKNILAL